VISREKLLAAKKELRKHNQSTGPLPDCVLDMHTLIDHGLECLDKIEGGAEQRDWAAERARSDKQVRLALDDLKAAIDRPSKAFYIADCIDKMLKAKTAWAREWAYYTPMIDEEFDA
jgi:hypothetical protein